MQSSSVVLRKTANTRAGADRLAHEAAVLRLAAHPNVVELVSKRVGDDHGSLRTATVAGSTLDETNLDLRGLVAVVLSAASTLAYIHQLDISHNRIDASHIIVRDTDTSAVLCGFAGSSLNASDDAKSKDVVALGVLLRNYIDRHHDPLRTRINGLVSSDADLAVSLRSIADIAIDGDMSASELGESLRQLLENTNLRNDATRPTRRPRWWAMTAAAIVPVALAGVGVNALSDPHTKAAATTVETKVAPCPHLQRGAIPIDTDDDGCPNSVFLGPGTISIDGEHYAVGNPTDRLLLGDWHGTGLATLALLRPSTGQIYVFNRWPTVGHSATPALVATIAGATDIADSTSNHHDVLVVTTTHGQVTVDPEEPTTTTVAP